MADLPIVFSESAATRIGAATRWAELQQGIPQDGYGSSPGNGLCLVRTRTTLPAGYTGAMAALGDVIEKQPDGIVNTLGQVWIKDQNGGTLSANTIYQARVGGTYTQDITTNGIKAPTTLGLYLVQLPVYIPDDHFRPYRPGLSNNNIIYVNGVSYMLLNYYTVMNWGPYILSDFYGSANSLSSLTLFMRKTKGILEYNNNKYDIYEWYSAEEWITGLVKINYENAMKPDGSTYNVQVLNPWLYAPNYGYGSPYGSDYDPTGYFSCKYRIYPGYRPYNYYTQFADQLICVAKVAKIPTTSGISTGIGSGISGV